MKHMHTIIAADDWWGQMSADQKRQYIKDHPNSKYAREHVKDDDKAAKPAKNPQKKAEAPAPAEHHKPLHDQPHKLSKAKIHHRIKQGVKDWQRDQREFFHGDNNAPKSEARRDVSTFVKDKAKGLLKSVKHEVKEWHLCATAVRDLTKGKKLDHHQKAALKTTAIHLGVTIASMAATGGLAHAAAHGLTTVLQHVGVHFLEHAALVTAGKVAAFAAEDGEKDDALMHRLIENYAAAIANLDVSDEQWADAIDATNADKSAAGDEEEDDKDEDEKDDDQQQQKQTASVAFADRVAFRSAVSAFLRNNYTKTELSVMEHEPELTLAEIARFRSKILPETAAVSAGRLYQKDVFAALQLAVEQ